MKIAAKTINLFSLLIKYLNLKRIGALNFYKLRICTPLVFKI